MGEQRKKSCKSFEQWNAYIRERTARNRDIEAKILARERKLDQIAFDKRCKSKTDFETWKMNKEYDELEARTARRKQQKTALKELQMRQDERGDPHQQWLAWVMQKEELAIKREQKLLRKVK